MVNGMSKSRLELIIPVSGTGRVRLVANQNGISQLEIDVVDREVYYDD